MRLLLGKERSVAGGGHAARAFLAPLATRSVLVFTLWSLAVLEARGATRLALVGSEGNGEATRALDLAEARLSAEKGIVLLERRGVQRVLTEQKLSLAGFVDAGSAVRVGKMLPVDLFAVLESSGSTNQEASKGWALVVFDAGTGVRFWDSAVPAQPDDRLADAVLAGVQAAREKQRRGLKKLRTLCFLTVRNADLPRELDSLCESTGLLLERQMTAWPDVAVLERKHLDRVTAERALPTEAVERELRASVVLVELQVGRGPRAGSIRGSARLTSRDGEALTEVSVVAPRPDIASLTRGLAQEIGRALQLASKGPPPDRFLEAQRFQRESKFWLAHRDYFAGARALEAAHALAPECEPYRTELVRVLADTATEFIDPGGQNWSRDVVHQAAPEDFTRALALGHRAADILLDYGRELTRHPPPSDSLPEFTKTDHFFQLSRFLGKVAQVRSRLQEELQPIFRSLYVKERAFRIEILEPFFREQVGDAKSFEKYGQKLFWLALSETHGCVEPDRYVTDVVSVMQHWLALAGRLNSPTAEASYAPMYHLTVLNGNRSGMVRGVDRRGYDALWDLMERDADPVIQAYAWLGRIPPTMSSSGRPTAQTYAKTREFRERVESVLTGIPTTNMLQRRRLYAPVYYALSSLLLNHTNQWIECAAAGEFMVAHKIFHPWLARDAVDALIRGKKFAEALALAEWALTVANDASVDLTPVSRAQLQGRLREQREQILKTIAGAQTVAAPPWRDARRLIDLVEVQQGLGWLLQPVVDGEVVYAAGLGAQPGDERAQFLQLLRIPLSGGAIQYLGTIPVSPIDWAGPGVRWDTVWEKPKARAHRRLAFATSACLTGGRYYLGTERGVFVFPLNGGSVERLTTTNGFPSEQVNSLACIGGQLYLGLGSPSLEGYLVAYDLAKGQATVLASSRRKGGQSPFDDQLPFHVPRLLPDPPRHRIVFPVGMSRTNELSGVWSYAPTTARFERLAHLPLFFPREAAFWVWVDQPDPETLIVFGASKGAWRFDLTRDEVTWFYRTASAASARETAANPGVGSAFPGRLGDGSLTLNPPFLFVDGWVWSTRPFQRVSFDGTQRQSLPSLRAQYEFEPTVCVTVPPDGRRLLVGDHYGLWLLELGPAGAGEADASSEPGP